MNKAPKRIKMIPPVKKRRKTASSHVEEITFDPEARQEYLSGFHKRKLQRIKHAQAVAAKKERAEKLEQRRKLRQERKDDAQRHVDTMNKWLRQARGDGGDDDASSGASSEAEEEGGGGGETDDAADWKGFGNTDDVKAIIDREDEYIDEDLYTTVTVKAIDVSRDGLRSVAEAAAQEDQDDEDSRKAGSSGHTERGKEDHAAPSRPPTKGSAVRKKKKKAFRYENKAERKVTRAMERLAKTRKGRKPPRTS